jgi:hypothetical protein
MIDINIYYCLIKSLKVKHIVLTEEEYFDPLDKNETYKNDGIPHFPHAYQYLDVKFEDIKWTLLKVTGTTDDVVIRTQFMQNGKGWMSHSKWINGFEEIIHVIKTLDDKEVVIKTSKPHDGNWMVVSNTINDKNDKVIDLTDLDNYYNNPNKLFPTKTEGSFSYATKIFE